jgi:hypothetical protein
MKTIPNELSQLMTPHALSAEPRISMGYISERYNQVSAPRPALKVTTNKLKAMTVTRPKTTGGKRLATDGSTHTLKMPMAKAWPNDPNSSNFRRPHWSDTLELQNDTITLVAHMKVEAVVVPDAGMPPSRKNMFEYDIRALMPHSC